MDSQYLFILGNAPELAEEELSCVLSKREIIPETLSFLGGTIKVAEIFSGSIAEKLIEGKQPGDRIVFGLSGEANIHDSKDVKNELEALGFKARFILPKFGENELSSVVVVKQIIDEIYLLPGLTAKTIWVQDFEDWGKRDYGRPAVDPHIGMLPPKVARMMINIAATNIPEPATILDPFCGVGTILAEGLMVGAKVIGSDIDNRQIERTRKNLDWMGKTAQLFAIDARQISKKIASQTVDAIVTEPDLGPNSSEAKNLRQVPDYLEKLYLDCLSDWKKVLKTDGKVVMVVPSVGQNDNSVKSLIDKAQIMGYSLVSGPFPYYRPQAVVRRNICVFKLNGSH